MTACLPVDEATDEGVLLIGLDARQLTTVPGKKEVDLAEKK